MFNFNPQPINSNVTVRNTDWVQVCPDCQHERTISYAQAYNIKKNKCTKYCKPCAINLGIIKVNTSKITNLNSENQKKATIGRTGIKRPSSSKSMSYLNLFNSEVLNTEESKIKQRNAKLGKFGEKSNRWDGGKTQDRRLAMSRDEYKQWRLSVFTRDNYTCTMCLVHGGKLQADHIKEWCNYPELRYELSNGRTLCEPCHKTTDNFGSKALRKQT